MTLNQEQRADITATIAASARQNNLSINWITDRGCLNCAAGNGLLSLYRDIFSEPPYLESFTDDEVFSFFMDTIDADGLVMTVGRPENTARVGAFVSSMPLVAKTSVSNFIGNHVDQSITAYFAEDGVSADLRRQGISNTMKKLLLRCNQIAGFDQVLLRTSVDSYPQISAVTKAGGHPLRGLFQSVASKKISGQVEYDMRGFFLFEKGRLGIAEPLTRVTVLRSGRHDTAIIHDAIPEDSYGFVEQSLKSTYTRVSNVVFNPAPDMRIPESRVVFDSRMYIPL